MTVSIPACSHDDNDQDDKWITWLNQQHAAEVLTKFTRHKEVHNQMSEMFALLSVVIGVFSRYMNLVHNKLRQQTIIPNSFIEVFYYLQDEVARIYFK